VTADKSIEQGTQLTPKFDADGLIPVIAQDSKTGQVLMFAYMNREALDLTIKTGRATYYSRSRGKLWTKGEQSGHFQKVDQILIDCDQDCVLLKVTVDAGQCHVGYQSCFYRAVARASSPCKHGQDGRATSTQKLDFIAKKVFDPSKVYDK
jgi:phosphoribosyl-AMP cyclohydrolase